MGVPKFYRWISERYPCLSEVVKDYQIPEFDNLYFDMNGIVHVCSHPEDDNPHFRITEEKIFNDICHYIEVLFRMIKPRKVFFMAVDGVAPRAKMNQQRGRRFRSAREAEDLVRKALEKGEVMPTQERFDSNCITPGTEFMVKLQEHLKYFIAKKISTDRMWQGVRVYLSGHETPGEGEHKIMDFIRREKSMPDYKPNTRHCLYGLDADLIMLGLITHEPHFSLLREEVKFGGKQIGKRSNAPEETTFHLLHLSLMREYLYFEFQSLKRVLKFPFNLENIIDDWVLMGFLVGNDFIPHLPYLHIHQDCLPMLWRTYKEVLPTLDGYLNESGKLSLPRFEKYIKAVSKIDIDNFTEKYADIKWLEAKMAKTGKAGARALRPQKRKQKHSLSSKATGIPTANEFLTLQDVGQEFSSEDEEDDDDLQKAMGVLPLELLDDDEEEDDDSDDEDSDDDPDSVFNKDFRKFKNDYYLDKMDLNATPAVLRAQTEGYITAIQWILFYYFDGVPSWSWFYQHHYAPYISDLRGFSNMKIELDKSQPFLPFQQLMAVLPAASKNLLPKPYQKLMISQESPIIEFYPTDFKTDLNGKQQDWEAVVLIPFIEERLLVTSMRTVEAQLTDEEKARNKHGPHILNEYTPDRQEPYPSSVPGTFPDIVVNFTKVTEVPKDFFVVPRAQLYKGLCPGVRLDVYFPGFPTMKHIKHEAELRKDGVKVFQMNSRGENMILQITEKVEKDVDVVVQSVLGQTTHVGWPHLFEARVTAVSDGNVKYSLIEDSSRRPSGSPNAAPTIQIHQEKMQEDDVKKWYHEVASITERYHDRRGVDIGDTHVMIFATPMVGRKYVCGLHGNITLEKQWANNSVPFAWQASMKDITTKDASFQQYKTLSDLFSEEADVFMLGSPHYGCHGKVLSTDEDAARVRVAFRVNTAEPNLERIMRNQHRFEIEYLPGHILSKRLCISPLIVSRITGTIFVNQTGNDKRGDRVNIALNLKYNKISKEVPGYSRKIQDGGWEYSVKTLDILSQYMQKFPDLFDFIGHHDRGENFRADEVFPEKGVSRLLEVKEYLKNVPCAKIEPAPQGSFRLDDGVVREIEREIDMAKNGRKKSVKMQVRPHLLYRPLDAQGTLVPDPSTTVQLYDIVANVRDGYSVPLGMRGIVIGITSAEKEQDILYEIVFEDEFLGGLTIRCSPNRAYRLPLHAFINISHSERKSQTVSPHKPTAVVKPQTSQHMDYSRAARHHDGNQHYSQDGQSEYDNLRHQNGRRRQAQQPYTAPQVAWRQAQQMSFSDNRQRQSETQQKQQPPQQQTWQQRETEQQHEQQTWQQQPHQPQQQTWQQQQHHQDQHQQPSHHAASTSSSQPPAGLNDPAQQNVAEFADIWSQLQAAVPPGGTDTGPSLNQAAQALSLSKLEMNLTGKTATNINRTKSEDLTPSATQKVDMGVDIQSLLVAGAVDAQTLEAQNKQSNDEFSKLFTSLQITASQKHGGKSEAAPTTATSEDGTAALCQMLNIEAAKDGEPTTIAEKDPTPGYVKQLSVKDLFDGAKQQETPSQQDHTSKNPTQPPQQKPKTEQPPAHHQPRHTAPTAPPPGHATHTAPPPGLPGVQHSAKRNVVELNCLCSATGMLPPRFDFQGGRDGKVRALVVLGNNQVFQGSFARNRDQAMESAAGNALVHLRPAFIPAPGMRQQTPHYPFSSSANSAFTPVRQPGMMGGFSGPPPGHPLYSWSPQRPKAQGGYPQQMSGGQQRAHHQATSVKPSPPQHTQHQVVPVPQQPAVTGPQTPQSDTQKATADAVSKTPSKDNPFIPLQVMRQQKTPQREKRLSQSDDVTTAAPTVQPNTGATSKQRESTPGREAATSSRESTPGRSSHKQTKTPQKSEQKEQSRRPKSRIAAKFPTMDKS